MVEFYVQSNTTTIPLGRQGENLARTIYFELSEMIEEYGAGTATLICLRSKDSAPYVCDTTQTSSMLSWTPTDTDTAYAGAGKCELRWVVGDVLAKSIVYRTSVTESITGDSTVPSEYESWYEALLEHISEYEIASDQIATNTSDIAVLDGRMDEFTTLPEGSTTGDAELIDIRVGADGTTYANAGTAVREQVNDVKTDLSTDRNLLNYEESIGLNKLDPTTILSNSNIENSSSLTNYGEVISGTYNVSDFIPVNGGDTVSWFYNNSETATTVTRTTMFRIAEYDENKDVITVSANWAASPFVTTDNTRFVRVVLQVRPLNMIVLNATDTSLPYSAYAETKKFKRIDDIEEALTDAESDIIRLIAKENPFEVILPSAVYGVTGQQINIYKQNLMLHNRLKSLAYIHTRLEHSYQNEERTIWNPTATELTEYTRNVEVFANGFGSSYVTYKSVKFYEVPKDTGNGNIKVLIVGDSKVANGYVSYHFLHNFDDDDMTCTLLGTQYDWQTENRNEGYGGKTAEWFCTNVDSPFSNNGAFDFANYLSANNIETPNYVFINLGTNDCGSKSAESSAFPSNYTTYISQMIESIHTVSSNIVVIIGMCEGASTVKDTNNAEFLKWDINEKISRLHKVTIELYDNRQNENIYVCPMYMGMDLTQDYNMTEEPLSSRDGDLNTGKTRMLITDHVHQNEVGYWKNADYMYALVKYIIAKSLA